MKIGSRGSARVAVGIVLGTLISLGILALAAFWKPPEDPSPPSNTPVNFPPEFLPETDAAGPDPGPETGILPSEPPTPFPAEGPFPDSGDSPAGPAPGPDKPVNTGEAFTSEENPEKENKEEGFGSEAVLPLETETGGPPEERTGE